MQAPRQKEREASKAKEEQARALVRKLADERRAREMQSKIRRDEETHRIM